MFCNCLLPYLVMCFLFLFIAHFSKIYLHTSSVFKFSLTILKQSQQDYYKWNDINNKHNTSFGSYTHQKNKIAKLPNPEIKKSHFNTD